MEEDHPLNPLEREVIVCAIEQAVNDAATQFNTTIETVQEELAATLTHDLRGPLTVINLAATRILRRPKDSDYCQQAAARINSSVGRLDLMIRALLDVSRLKGGKRMSLNIEPFDSVKLVNQLAADFNIIYDGRVVVHSDVSGDVHWDQAEICRLLEDLTNNAAKYGSKKELISITLTEKDKKVTLSVHNVGSHIPARERDALFLQFHRGRSTDQQKGWGIGLTVVKSVVEAHKGRISIDSTQKTGTTFIVQLPKDARNVTARASDVASAHQDPKMGKTV